MRRRIRLDVHPQPDDITCGPTCLHAVYRLHGLDLPLQRIIDEVPALEGGGTLAVTLGCHALRHGFAARMHVFNVRIFDPTWFTGPDGHADPALLAQKLRAQRAAKSGRKLRLAIDAYLEFLELGGQVQREDLTTALLRRYLNKGTPLLTGLSATYLYACAREVDDGPGMLRYDDVAGEPTGHFVILAGYDRRKREVLVADPLSPDAPTRQSRLYHVGIDRLMCAILVGILTYDGNLLALTRDEPPERARS